MEKPFVLLADDNEATCTLVTALLQADFVVDVATDGGEAIEKLKSRQYAAILLDLLMPLVDGYAVLDFLREHRPDLLPRVVVVTASSSSRHVDRINGYGVFGVVAKPFEVEALHSTVHHVTGNKNAPPLRGPLLSSGMILLLGELLRRV
ncbi:MAG TPA: response regulator [Thermoanaerobaculia bacterium]